MKSPAALINLSMLYAGKTAGIIVAFVFLPLYNQLLGATQFGIVAVLLSVQALLLMTDLGMTALINRDAAAMPKSAAAPLIRLIRSAELILAAFYLATFVAVVLLKSLTGFPNMSWGVILGAVALFWAIVIQNLYYSTSLSSSDFKTATIVQVGGVLIRAGLTWYVLANYSSSVSAFIAVQTTIAVLHALTSRHLLMRKLSSNGINEKTFEGITVRESLALLKRGFPLLITGLAGAAAMHLDKPILSIFIPAPDVAAYFLATTLSATPVAILASPVVQYFQPKIIQSIASGNTSEAAKRLRLLFLSIAATVLVPMSLLIFFCDEVVSLWLQAPDQVELVASYSKILLIGYIVAALGYVPLIVIIAKQAFKFQARLSIATTAILLIAITISSALGDVSFVCASYVGYFAIVTACLLWRAKTGYVDQSKT